MSNEEIHLELDPEFLKQLGALDPVQEAVKNAAEEIAEYARQNAPVASGDYQASIRAEPSNKAGSKAWVVLADDPLGVIEFGTSTQEGHYTLRSSVEGTGHTFAKKRR
jgi:hypothetical protein